MGPRLHPRRLHAPSVASDHPRRALGSTLFFPTCTPPRLPTAAPVTTLTTAGSSSTSRCPRRSCDPRRRWPSSYPPPTCSAATTATASPRRTALRFGPRALNQRAVTRFPRPLLRHHLHPRDRHALRPARSHVRHLLRRLLLPVYQFTIHAPRITSFDRTLVSTVIYSRALPAGSVGCAYPCPGAPDAPRSSLRASPPSTTRSTPWSSTLVVFLPTGTPPPTPRIERPYRLRALHASGFTA